MKDKKFLWHFRTCLKKSLFFFLVSQNLMKLFIAICTGIQRDGKAMAETVNRAKPSSKELCKIFGTHISRDTLVLTDGFRSYNRLGAVTSCTVLDVNHEENKKFFNLNIVNSLHSFIKETYSLCSSHCVILKITAIGIAFMIYAIIGWRYSDDV